MGFPELCLIKEGGGIQEVGAGGGGGGGVRRGGGWERGRAGRARGERFVLFAAVFIH